MPDLGEQAPHPETPEAALAALMAGNERYRTGELSLRDHSPVGYDRAVAQKPFAAVVACSDSRVSPNLIFDVERGNIFNSKVAGNSIAPAILGSTEFAVAVLGVKLVMVLGHSDCGAVKAAIDVTNGQEFPEAEFGQIGAIVDAVVPSVKRIDPAERTLDACVSANARDQADRLAAAKPIIAPALAAGRIDVVAGVYDIGSGRVSLLD